MVSNLLNTNKMQTTLLTPDPAKYSKSFNLNISNNILTTNPFPKILGLTLDRKLSFTEHIENNLNKGLQNHQKNKEILNDTYKSITRPILEYFRTTWAPVISTTKFNHFLIVQNQIARTATGHKEDTNDNMVNTKSKLLSIESLKTFHSSNLRHQKNNPDHPLIKLPNNPALPCMMEKSIFYSPENLI